MHTLTVEELVLTTRAGLVDIDLTMAVILVVFLTLLVILNQLVFKPVLDIQQMRYDRTQGAVAAAESMQTKANAQVARYEELVSEARQKGSAEFSSLREEGRTAADKAVNTAREQAESNVSKLTAELRAKAEQSRQELQSHTAGISELIVAKVIDAGTGGGSA